MDTTTSPSVLKPWIKTAYALLENSLGIPPKELNELDWKLTLTDGTNKLAEHLSAFANQPGGGFIVVGIDNKTGKVKGVDSGDMGRMIELMANVARDKLEPCPRLDHEALSWQGKPLLAFYIEESKFKPVHLRGKSIEASYIRNGATTQLANRHELANLLLNSHVPHWEWLPAHTPVPADKVLKLLDYEAIAKLKGQPVLTSQSEILADLNNNGMAEPERGLYYATNFGAIAAAADIRLFEDLRRKALRIIRYKGVSRSLSLSEKVGQKGYAIGFEGIFRYLNDILPQHEVISGPLRKTVRMYPELALRELIANALIHQDFMIRGMGPMVEIFDDRIEITSPGRLLKSKRVDRLFGTNPESRNEVLASYFRQYRICEERGSGLLKALDSVEEQHLPPLKLEEGENYFRVTMYAPRKFTQMSHSERLSACYQHAISQYYKQQAMTNSTLRERFQLGEKQISTVSKLIKEAQAAGLVKPKDPDNKSAKYAKYIPSWA